MDALKRAEEAKHQRTDPKTQPARPADAPTNDAPGNPGDAEVKLELLPDGGLPEISEHTTAVDEELRASASNIDASPARPGARAATANPIPADVEQATARNVFAAKHTEAVRPSRFGTIVIILTFGGLAGLTVGGYFYSQIQQISGRGMGVVAAPAARSAPLATPATVAATSPATPPASVAAVAPPSNTSAPTVKTPPPEMPVARAPAAPAVTIRAAPAKGDESPVRISRNTPKLDPALAVAYQSLQSGEFDAAREAYERTLHGDRNSTDALTGLAVIAARAGKTDNALTYYARALEADPKNVAALAGVIALRGFGDPGASESRLKSILANQTPDSVQAGMIQFTLGNLYAAQQRWNEAQQAYFQAYATDGNNPDYQYNLAISLDHLHQSRLAAQYYQSALVAAGSRAAGFDRTQAQARLVELQR